MQNVSGDFGVYSEFLHRLYKMFDLKWNALYLRLERVFM